MGRDAGQQAGGMDLVQHTVEAGDRVALPLHLHVLGVDDAQLRLPLDQELQLLSVALHLGGLVDPGTADEVEGPAGGLSDASDDIPGPLARGCLVGIDAQLQAAAQDALDLLVREAGSVLGVPRGAEVGASVEGVRAADHLAPFERAEANRLHEGPFLLQGEREGNVWDARNQSAGAPTRCESAAVRLSPGTEAVSIPE